MVPRRSNELGSKGYLFATAVRSCRLAGVDERFSRVFRLRYVASGTTIVVIARDRPSRHGHRTRRRSVPRKVPLYLSGASRKTRIRGISDDGAVTLRPVLRRCEMRYPEYVGVYPEHRLFISPTASLLRLRTRDRIDTFRNLLSRPDNKRGV